MWESVPTLLHLLSNFYCPRAIKTPKSLIVLGGPTASGKTALAIRLAQYFQAPILSADSRQCYRQMTIGTAKPTAEELEQAPHFFINHLSIEQPFSVNDYVRLALHWLEQAFQQHDFVILVGGTGLYINALCQGMDDFPDVALEIRQNLEREYQQHGLHHLQAELQKVDPVYYAAVDEHNPHRLIRALAFYRATGQPFSDYRKGQGSPRFFQPIYLQLHRPRTELYARIDDRVHMMIQQGLLDEAQQLYAFRQMPAMQTVGYQECFDYLDGKISWPSAIELIQRNSRRYAKRQLTWMRRDGHWKMVQPHDWPLILAYIQLAREQSWRLQTENTPVGVLDGIRADQQILLLQGHTRLAALAIVSKKNKAIAFQLENADGNDQTNALELLIHQWRLNDGLEARYAVCPADHQQHWFKMGWKLSGVELLELDKSQVLME